MQILKGSDGGVQLGFGTLPIVQYSKNSEYRTMDVVQIPVILSSDCIYGLFGRGFEAHLDLEMRAIIFSLFLCFGLKKGKLSFGRLTIRDDSDIRRNLIQWEKSPNGREKTNEDSVTTIINAFTTEVHL